MKLRMALFIFFTALVLVFSCSDPKAKVEAKQKEFFKALSDDDMAKLEELVFEVDINKANENGDRAIDLAIKSGNKAQLIWLLDKKADIMARNAQGETAYQAALNQNQPEMALLLLSHGDVVNRKAWIIAPEGLRFRDNPGLDSMRLGVIPANEEILVIKVSAEEFAISGDKGKWAYIDWNGKKGWVFDAYISFQQDLKRVLAKNPRFRADHLDGADKERAAVSVSEELVFLKDTRCVFSRTSYFSDSTAKSAQNGLYTIDANKVVLLLDKGTKTIAYNNGRADEKEELGAEELVLVWKDELSGFLHEADAGKLENSDFILDETTHQLKKEKSGDFEYTGYFYQFQ
ncbi:MAG: SH3 domain-containing protein [Spirochaetales bacterium]|nr:SH3 domain-containing protein [Spirochaetales bacterium]